jgi:hypothetical protein
MIEIFKNILAIVLYVGIILLLLALLMVTTCDMVDVLDGLSIGQWHFKCKVDGR